jgi:hypothetical protein
MVVDRRYLADFIRALGNALWSGFGITDTLIVVIIVFLYVANYFFPEMYSEGAISK